MKKVLIVTYYWPPTGGGGVQRWLKFAKYLPSFGWKPTIVTPENPERPSEDESLLKDVDDKLIVIKLPIFEPYSLFKKLTGRKKSDKVNTGLLFDDNKQSFIEKVALWIRGNVLIPDPRIFWVKPTVKYLKKHVRELSPDIVITTGTPHSVHLIGHKLAKQTGAKWLADFRDPWSDLDIIEKFYPTRWALKKHQRLEKKILDDADYVLTVSKTWAKELQNKTHTPVGAITNGYDSDDFQAFNSFNKQNDKFTIGHFGIINSYRNPTLLWHAINELCEENESFRKSLCIKLTGTVDQEVIKSVYSYNYLDSCIEIGSYLKHSALLQEYANTDVLLVLLNQSKNSAGHIPGKIFEYLATGKSILGIGPKEGDAGKIISSVSSNNLMITAEEKEQIKSYLLERFEIFRVAKHKSIEKNENVSQFSRKHLTNELATILNQL